MSDELDAIIATDTPTMAAKLRAIAIAQLEGRDTAAHERELARAIGQNQALADLFSRRRLVLELEKLTGEKIRGADLGLRVYAFDPGRVGAREFAVDWIPRVGFDEAAASILQRFPVLAAGWRDARDAYEVGAFALARAAAVNVAEHVQGVIATAIDRGTDGQQARDEIAAALREGRSDVAGASFVDSYADTVFRTTTTGAYAQGRRAQAADPAIRPFLGAWRYAATPDSDVRPNHIAADGFVAAIDDPVWRELTPPLGFNCRCALEIVSRDEALRSGLVGADGSYTPQRPPAGAGPDEGFRNLNLAAI